MQTMNLLFDLAKSSKVKNIISRTRTTDFESIFFVYFFGLIILF